MSYFSSFSDYLTTDVEEKSTGITHTGPLSYLDLSKETQENTELLKILSDIGAPLHSYRTLIQWAQKHSLNGYNFQMSRSTYGSMISHLQRTFQMHEYRPTIYEVPANCSTLMRGNLGIHHELMVRSEFHQNITLSKI